MVSTRSGLFMAAALFAGVLPQGQAADFPSRPVALVVPFSPGGGTDTIARALAEGMSKALSEPVVIENKPGAGTIIGTSYVAQSKPDGYTLVMATFAHAVNPLLYDKLSYDPHADFTPVALVARSPNILVVKSDSPFKSVQDIVDTARREPGKLNYGSFGNGTSAHLTAVLFENLANIKMTHIPYKGSSPALTDLLGGRIDMMFGTVSGVGPQIKSGDLRALAVTSDTRSSAFPQVPTMAEAGVKGYKAEAWYGLFAPAGTPADVVSTLNAAVKAGVKTSAFHAIIESNGLMVDVKGPQQLQQYVDEETARWKPVIEQAGIRLSSK